MLIVDSQIHIWKNHLPGNPAHRQVLDYTQDDALREMDEAGVDAAVIHPGMLLPIGRVRLSALTGRHWGRV